MRRCQVSILLLYDGTLSAKNQSLALGRALAQASSALACQPEKKNAATKTPIVQLHTRHFPLRLSFLPAAVHGWFFWVIHRIGGPHMLARWMEYEGVKDLEQWRNVAMIVACGRKTAPLSFALSRFFLPGKPMNVQINHPRCGNIMNRVMFDVIVSPRHDLPKGNPPDPVNRFGDRLILPILGNVTIDRNLVPVVFTGFVQPGATVVLIGGPTHRDNSRARVRVAEAIIEILEELDNCLEGERVVICSRRTPAEVETWLRQAWRGRFWTAASEEPNPYNEAMMLGGRFVVTSDSTSMICDAIATGNHAFIADIPVHGGRKSKFERFQEDVVQRGYCTRLSLSRSFEELQKDSTLEAPPNDTKNVARTVWTRYLKAQGLD